MEVVGCLRTWGLELLTPNPSSKNTPRTIIIVIIIVRGEEGGKKTLKLSNTQQDTLNTTHCKTAT